jgi:hypothetical protein
MASATTEPVGLVGQVSRSLNAPVRRASGPRVAAKRLESANEPSRTKAADVGAVSGSNASGAVEDRSLPSALALQSRALVGRSCAAQLADGHHCGATRLRDDDYCFWHSPDHAQEAENARRLGGLRRRREKTITAVYDLDSLGSVDGIRRVLDIVVADALGLENSVGRSRVLIAAAMAATRLLELDEIGTRQALLALPAGEDEETRRA